MPERFLQSFSFDDRSDTITSELRTSLLNQPSLSSLELQPEPRLTHHCHCGDGGFTLSSQIQRVPINIVHRKIADYLKGQPD